ncbi:unnamed protein product [Scytosiphon promiscuus]
MSGVDYSKWDKMANEMSDSDDDNGNRPEVTTFDEPQSVTFGGTPESQAAAARNDTSDSNGDDHPPRASPSVAAPIDGSVGAAVSTATVDTGTAAPAPRPKIQAPISDHMLAENGAAVHRDTGDGREVLHYVWRQARAEVTVVVPVPPGTRAGDVEVSLRAKPETIAEGVADLIRVSIRVNEGGNRAAAGEASGVGLMHLLEGELAFQAKLEADSGGEVDWELKDYPGTSVARDSPGDSGGDDGGSVPSISSAAGATTGGASTSSSGSISDGDRRGVEIVLRKHCPVPNATVWWKSLLKGGPEIDVSAIKGRATNNHQSVWEEALGMFKDKVAARKAQGKISVDTGEHD